MGKVTTLTPREVVCQDVEAIAVIYRNLGAPTAEKMVTRALGELALDDGKACRNGAVPRPAGCLGPPGAVKQTG
jgi:hypothetical protein